MDLVWWHTSAAPWRIIPSGQMWHASSDRLKGLPFLWGAATSAHQVEGGNEANDWWEWELAEGSGCVEASGQACQHLTRYPDDIAMLGGLGLNCYRFSVEWSRIEPRPGEFSAHWMEHYRRVIRTCHEHGLLAIVTLHHFTNPLWLARAGGWENPAMPERFARYCGVLARELLGQADAAITINEPNIPALMGYEVGAFPPGKRDRAARIRVSESFIAAHRQAVRAIRDRRGELPVGLALAMADWQALPGGEGELAEVRRLREDIFLEATAEDDFVGVNTYTRHRIGPQGWAGNEDGVELTSSGYEFWPQALQATLERAWELTHLPLVVTESGIATNEDEARVRYIDGAVAAMRRAMEKGVDVRGFIYWSALDNFEWHHGYEERFGLIGVDRATQRRTVRPSARHLGRLAASGATGADPSPATP